MARKNVNLNSAKSSKNDEFYTQLTDVERELEHYKEFFKGKKVLCNCNDDKWSSFFKYFSLNFEHLGLAKLTCVSFNANGNGKKYEFNDEEVVITDLVGNGDFRSVECIVLLKDCDVVVTNPPFSLFRGFIALMAKYNKKFLVVGPVNCITCKEIFPLIKENKMWLGVNSSGGTKRGNSMSFYSPCDDELKGVPSWFFTNIPHEKQNTPLDLFKKYNAEEYPKYDNCNAIECSKTANIPMDYEGVIGVPITFLDKYCPEQFEIIGHAYDLLGDGGSQHIGHFEVNGKHTYVRILIRKK